MRKRIAPRALRLLLLAVVTVSLQGLECKKSREHFDALLTEAELRDETPPRIFDFMPPAGLVYNGDNIMFNVEDPQNGAPPSGLGPDGVHVTVDGTMLPLERSGPMYTATLGQLSDGFTRFVVDATDLSGNSSTATHELTIDRTAPTVNLSTTPPSTAETNQPSFMFEFAGMAMDPNLEGGSLSVRQPASDGSCSPDGTLWPVGSTGGTISQNTFSIGPSGSVDVASEAFNGVASGGSSRTATYCSVLRLLDTARGKTGEPNPNTAVQTFRTDLTWQPPPSLGGVYGSTGLSVTGGDASHECCVWRASADARIRVALNSPISLTGDSGFAPSNFVPLDGDRASDGTFTASGNGTVAGISNVEVTATGTLTAADGLDVEITVGPNGELPGGQPIIYRFQGVRLSD